MSHCHTFLYVARVRKHTDMRELHAFRVQFSQRNGFCPKTQLAAQLRKSDADLCTSEAESNSGVNFCSKLEAPGQDDSR